MPWSNVANAPFTTAAAAPVVLESDNLANAGAIDAAEINVTQSLLTGGLASAGAIESGFVAVTVSLTATGLAASGAIEAGSMLAPIKLATTGLAASGAIEAGLIVSDKILTATGIAAAGGIQAVALEAGLVILTTESLTNSGAIQSVLTNVPFISDVEDIIGGDAQLWFGSQAHINGLYFGSVQGGSTIAIEDDSGSESPQTVDSWSDTQITFTPNRGSLSGGPFKIHVDR